MFEECKECGAAPAGSTRCHVAFNGKGTKSRCPLDGERKKAVGEKLFPAQNGVHPTIAQPPVITAEEFAKRNGDSAAGVVVKKFLKAHPHSQD